MTGTDEQHNHTRYDLPWFAVVTVTILGHVVGNFTGDFQGQYAQSDVALWFQGLAVVSLLLAMLLWDVPNP